MSWEQFPRNNAESEQPFKLDEQAFLRSWQRIQRSFDLDMMPSRQQIDALAGIDRRRFTIDFLKERYQKTFDAPFIFGQHAEYEGEQKAHAISVSLKELEASRALTELIRLFGENNEEVRLREARMRSAVQPEPDKPDSYVLALQENAAKRAIADAEYEKNKKYYQQLLDQKELLVRNLAREKVKSGVSFEQALKEIVTPEFLSDIPSSYFQYNFFSHVGDDTKEEAELKEKDVSAYLAQKMSMYFLLRLGREAEFNPQPSRKKKKPGFLGRLFKRGE